MQCSVISFTIHLPVMEISEVLIKSSLNPIKLFSSQMNVRPKKYTVTMISQIEKVLKRCSWPTLFSCYRHFLWGDKFLMMRNNIQKNSKCHGRILYFDIKDWLPLYFSRHETRYEIKWKWKARLPAMAPKIITPQRHSSFPFSPSRYWLITVFSDFCD